MWARAQRPVYWPAHRVGGRGFEPRRERRDGRGRRVLHERVQVVGFAVELDRIDVEFNAPAPTAKCRPDRKSC